MRHGRGRAIHKLARKPVLTFGRTSPNLGIHWPYWIGYMGGLIFDFLSKVTRKKHSVSRIRVKKFCSTTQFNSSVPIKTNFVSPFTLKEGLKKTIKKRKKI